MGLSTSESVRRWTGTRQTRKKSTCLMLLWCPVLASPIRQFAAWGPTQQGGFESKWLLLLPRRLYPFAVSLPTLFLFLRVGCFFFFFAAAVGTRGDLGTGRLAEVSFNLFGYSWWHAERAIATSDNCRANTLIHIVCVRHQK